MRSAAIIGWAWRTPLGGSIDEALARLLAGERAARRLDQFETYPCALVAPLLEQPKPSRERRFARRMEWFGIEVALEALAHAQLQGSERLGLFSGVGGLHVAWDDLLTALERQDPGGASAWDRGLKQLHPFWMLQHLSNTSHALVSAELGIRGDGATFGGPCAGAQALDAALRSLEAFAVDTALVFAHDSLLAPETLIDLGVRGDVAQSDAHVFAPYDERANGFVPGEAAAAVVLQRAADSNGRALAYVDACTVADGERGEPASATIALAAKQLAQGVELIDGAARACLALDQMERQALGAVVGEDLPLTAISSATGRLGAAMPVVQTIALAALLRRSLVPAIATLDKPASGPLRPVTTTGLARARLALGLSTGAPGHASAIRVEIP